MINTKITTAFMGNKMALRICILCAFAVFISACATTGGNQPDAKQEITPQNKQEAQTGCGKEDSGTVKCTPAGVIEISEDYGVDPEVRKNFDKAVTLLNEEKYPEAITLLKGVISKTDKFTAPYINLGIAYSRTGEMEKAEDNFKKALEINNRHPVALNELGLVYRKTGRYEKAREIYQSTLELYPDFLPARKNLGVLCDIYVQDLKCALEEYEAYLKSVPDDKAVKIWVADVKSRMK